MQTSSILLQKSESSVKQQLKGLTQKVIAERAVVALAAQGPKQIIVGAGKKYVDCCVEKEEKPTGI